MNALASAQEQIINAFEEENEELLIATNHDHTLVRQVTYGEHVVSSVLVLKQDDDGELICTVTLSWGFAKPRKKIRMEVLLGMNEYSRTDLEESFRAYVIGMDDPEANECALCLTEFLPLEGSFEDVYELHCEMIGEMMPLIISIELIISGTSARQLHGNSLLFVTTEGNS